MKVLSNRRGAQNADAQLALFANGGLSSVAGGCRRAIDREAIEVGLGIIAADTWPSRYKVHKYWGRKPANVVERYIEFFTSPGDTIVDPFSGSGVTVVEAARLKRNGVGFDLNPFAVRLGSAMLCPPSPKEYADAAAAVIAKASKVVGHLYVALCDSCANGAILRSVGYVGTTPIEVRYKCDVCRKSGCRAPTSADLELIKTDVKAPSDAPDEEILFGWEMQKLKRRGVRRWRELFTSRNFAAAAELRRAVLELESPTCRDWLLLTLTASLAQFTRMIADFSGDAGGPSWKINCYWLPDKWQELNPLWYFNNRVSKSLESIKDLVSSGAPFPTGAISSLDSRCMPLQDSSVDYIFTDPPYGGEGIQYGELSLLWCLWLGEREDLAAEIAFNPHRNLDQDSYSAGLHAVFAECYRILKPDHWMTVTFANKDPMVWDALMSACRTAGFSLVTAAPMKRSAPSLTETTMHTAPKSDLVLTFQKETNRKYTRLSTQQFASYSLEDAVTRIASAMRREGLNITSHDVFDRITVDWFSWYYENGERPNAVQPTLANVESTLLMQPGGKSEFSLKGNCKLDENVAAPAIVEHHPF